MDCLPNFAATSDNHSVLRDDGGWEVLTRLLRRLVLWEAAQICPY